MSEETSFFAATRMASSLPTLLKSCSAVCRSKAAIVAEPIVETVPYLKIPETENGFSGPRAMTRIVSPTLKCSLSAEALSIATSLEVVGKLPVTSVSGLNRWFFGSTLTAIAGAPCVENVVPLRRTSLAVSVIEPAAAATSGRASTLSRTEAGNPPVSAAPLFELEIVDRAVMTALVFL